MKFFRNISQGLKFFRNISLGLKFMLSSLVTVVIFFSICLESIKTINNCHMACGMLLGGAMTTKALLNEAHSDFLVLSQTAERSIVYAEHGDALKSAELAEEFRHRAESLNERLSAIRSALKADMLVNSALIDEIDKNIASAADTLNNQYLPAATRAAQSGPSAAEFAELGGYSDSVAETLNTAYHTIADEGDDIYANYVEFLESEITRLQVVDFAALTVSIILIALISLAIRRPVRDAQNAMREVAGGNFIETRSPYKDEISSLLNSASDIIDNFKVINGKIHENALSLSAGDIDARIDESLFHGDYVEVIRAVNGTVDVVAHLTSEVEKQKRIAEAASIAKSSFLAMMSHEIRTPMNAIIGISQIQLMKQNLPEDIADALTRIRVSGNGLLGIINDILDISKIESGKLEINPIDYDLPSLINDAVQLNIVRIASKPIELLLEIDPRLYANMRGDELRIKQILNNILSNAFKYTEKGSVIFAVSCAREGDAVWLTFRVADTGQGMSEENVKTLFDEYSRFNESANRSIEGTGLGMNITGKLVSLMNGEIKAESELGKGSTFTVTIEQGYLDDVVIGEELAEKLRLFEFTANNEHKSQSVVYHNMPYGRVLVVDDVETNLFVAKGLMAPYNLTVETAESGFDALGKVQSGAVYDVIFMDHMMPKMDGIETTAKIRALGYRAPIVALTANAISGNDKMFKENGFDDFISKPIDVRQLNAALNKLIRDKNKGGEITEIPKQENFSEELFQFFKKDAAKAIVTLSETAENGDLLLFATTAHAMKSACANVGEKELSELAKELEFAGKRNDTEFIAVNVGKLIERLRGIVGAYMAPQNTDGIIEDTVLLAKYLKIIKRAAEDYDDNAAGAAIEELRKVVWKPETVELLDKLETYLLHSDFDEAGELIDMKLTDGGGI
jgi:signal transduction histidine kinase/CheY-like chemotaxis protein